MIVRFVSRKDRTSSVVCCAAAGAIETPNTMHITNAATSVIRLRVLDLEVIVVFSGISFFRSGVRYRNGS